MHLARLVLSEALAVDELDLAGITVFPDTRSLQPARQVILVVLRLGGGRFLASHYEQLLSRLSTCSAEQQTAFLALTVSRAVRAFAVSQPENPKARLLHMGINEILGLLPAPFLRSTSLEPVTRLADELLQASAADGDDGEPKDRVGFYVGAATALMCGLLTGRLDGPKHAAMCASHVIHVIEQVYEDEEIGRREKDWQACALLSADGPLAAEAILVLPNYDPGPVYRSRR